MTTVLLTGFEPFGGDAANPSGEAVHLVAQRWSGPEELVTAVLPVTFRGAADQLKALVARHAPDVVIACGLAGGRAAIGVERVALNLIDARIPDNDGEQPVDVPSAPGAPTAHLSTLPVKEVVRRIAATGVPAEVSHSAGTFVCNHVFFTALESVHASARAGFIHVPWSAEHAPSPDAPSLPLLDIARALAVAVRASIDVEDDARVTGGAIH